MNIGDLKISRMVETQKPLSPRSPNADIFLKATDSVIDEVNKELDQLPMFQYDLVVDEPEAYFNRGENDAFYIS